MGFQEKKKNELKNNELIEFSNVVYDSGIEEKKGIIKERKQQITITMEPSLIYRIDKIASENGQSRAAFISMACINTLNNGLKIQGER